ncbi:HdeD family acid-resistance protein [Bosea sp. TAF32]|uniref:HdeD family acid-resistance protein n=1 Tax=Bosea sp. TAF32 TaxID=3237482 RepID=UPI003F8D9C81
MSLSPSQDPELAQARNAVLAENWWLVALRGALAILFGIIAFIIPGTTMLALVLIFAAYSFVDGIFGVVSAIRGARKSERWGLLLVNGLLGIAIGIAAALWPGITVLAFVFMVGAWALLSGGLLLAAAFGLKISHGRWLLVLGALLSMLYGVLLFAAPMIGALVLTWWVGAHAVVFGAILIILAFRLRKHRGEQIPTAMATSS